MKTKNKTLQILLFLIPVVLMLAFMAVYPSISASAEDEQEYTAVNIEDNLDLTGAKIYIDVDILLQQTSADGLFVTSGGYSFDYDNGFTLEIRKDSSVILTPLNPVNIQSIGYFEWECPADIGTVTYFNDNYADAIYALIVAEPEPEPTEEPTTPLDDISNFLSTADLASILILLGGAVVIAMVIGKLLR